MALKRSFLFLACAGVLASSAFGSTIILGAFNFNDQQFGDSLDESDGGTWRNAQWLNIVNSNPGNAGALTGANFNTGIANIGPPAVGVAPNYTIHYNTAIVNAAGADFGIVAARFSTDDFTVAVSSDGGITFSGFQTISAASAASTGVSMNYFWGGGGQFSATLFVYSVDLSLFGIANGGSVSAIRITSPTEGDLIRVAGLGGASAAIPEPSTTILIGGGLLAVAGLFARRMRP